MRSSFRFALSAALGLSSLLLISCSQNSVATLDIASGSATIVHDSATTPGHTGSPLAVADSVHTSSGSQVSIVLQDGSVVRLDGNTDITIQQLLYKKTHLGSADFTVKQGGAWSDVEALAPGGTFNVETPDLVATVRGTSFGVQVQGDTSDVFVTEHQVDVSLKSDPKTWKHLKEGEWMHMVKAKMKEMFQEGAKPMDMQAMHKHTWFVLNEREHAKWKALHRRAPGASASSASSFVSNTKSSVFSAPRIRGTSSAASLTASSASASSTASVLLRLDDGYSPLSEFRVPGALSSAAATASL
jgi:hypothetical protein